MPNSPKVLFVFFALLALLAILLLHSGIDRLKRSGTPPFNREGHLVTMMPTLPMPPSGLTRRLDSAPCRAGAWLAAIVIPIIAALLTFRAQRPFAGFALLLLWFCVAGFFGVWVWLFSMFNSLST